MIRQKRIASGANEGLVNVAGSAADKAGLKEGDIILEFNGEKITVNNSLAKMIQNWNPGDKVTLKILTSGQEKVVTVILGERSE